MSIKCIILQSLPWQLRLRAEKTFQVTVQETFATAIISVRRNSNGPILSSNVYRKTISEDTQLGASVLQILATDQDGVSLYGVE